ncbi:hypothetical protein EVAR_98946_1 [Eumeta japonica]|uniref:Uncharacterized protein n=1 Tax=Eumeta variegata TaxID=151549 RepID=A0A4C1SR20_EUMVA|nr:hypothetical protein EVAR_98946_1 [Eumeta japonica]
MAVDCFGRSREMNSRITNTTYWTDSKTVLSWINADPRSFKPFVAHRLAEIEETSSAKNWRWVPSGITSPTTPRETRLTNFHRNTAGSKSVERFKSHKRSNTLDKAKNRQIVELTSKYLYAGESYSSRRHKETISATNFDVSKRRTDAQKSKLRNMCVELDQDDVMRATGRLDRHQSLDAESKRPVILDSKNRITELLIQKRTKMRTARRAVEGSRTSFSLLGDRLLGPMIVTVGRRTEKRWGVLITCLTTRRSSRDSSQSHAVVRHTALRRFMARRGTPTVIAQAKRRDAAHLIVEVEHIVNSRPLTPVEPDLNREALTPNHFLIGRSCGISPIGIFKATDADSHTWKTAQRLADEFWHRWSMEYLPNLLRKTSTAGHLEPKVGIQF